MALKKSSKGIVEHPRTGTLHIAKVNQSRMPGTETFCGIQLSTAPGVVYGDGDQCKTCQKEAERRKSN